jgi:ribose transport system ATP-binding protein
VQLESGTFAAQLRDRGRGTVLAARGVTKAFGGTQALAGVDLELRPGEVHGLVGENGSGTSTLVKILAGVHQADAGSLASAAGEVDAARMTPQTAAALGIHVVHQDAPVFGTLSVAENLFLGRGFPTRRGGSVDWREVARRARWVLDRFHVPARPGQPCNSLDPAVRAMVAVARALQDCEDATDGVLVLDEPTAALTETEVRTLLAAIRRYAEDGQAILLVTHRLDEVLSACARVTVLRDGRRVATRDVRHLARADLVELIVGAAAPTAAPPAEVRAGPRLLELEGVTAPPLRDVDLHVDRGEIVGVAGLMGAGRTELLLTVYGERPRDAGTIRLGGVPLHAHGPGDAIDHGIALVPEDRRADAAFATLTVSDNLAAGASRRYWRGGRMRRAAERGDARALIARFGIEPPNPDAPMATLSGGNQQKVVLASRLRRDPQLLLLDEPTQGVDVGARAQIHTAIREAVAAGAGALVVSSDLGELLELCHRIVIVAAGQVVAELHGAEIERERLAALMHAEPEPTPVGAR